MKINIRVTALIISLTIIFSISGFDPAKAASEDFVIENGVLIEYKGSDSKVDIPDNLGITEIGDGAFEGNKNLTEVTIPEGIKKIGNFAFSSCYRMTKISIPSSVESIQDYAFRSCFGLQSLSLTDSIKEIGEGAFSFCSDLSYVDYPIHLDYLGDEAFRYCEKLVKAEWPQSVDTIGTRVFLKSGMKNPIILNNGKLLCYVPPQTESYQIPNTVTEIAGGAFYDCSAINSISIPSSVTKVGCSAFTGTAIKDPIYINNGMTLCYVPSTTEEYTITNQGTEIAGGAFRGCEELKSVTLPDSLTKINDETFYDCVSLINIDLPESLTSIGSNAFTYCRKLTNVTLPDRVTEIKDYAFYWCESLGGVTIPGNVSSVGNSAFYECSQLSMVIFENGVKSIGAQAFSYCSHLSSVSIPDSMREIGEGAFSACDSLKTITIPSSVTSLGNEIFFWTHVTVTGEAGSAIQTYCAKYYCPFIVTDLSRDAVPTGSAILLNGGKVTLEAYNIQGNNYFKLRDLAMVLRETGKAFQVEYDSSTNTISISGGKAYTPLGGELTVSNRKTSEKAKLSTVKVTYNGGEVDLQAYNIYGFNYFKLRDVAAVIDVGVTWDGKTGTIGIDTSIGYSS